MNASYELSVSLSNFQVHTYKPDKWMTLDGEVEDAYVALPIDLGKSLHLEEQVFQQST